MKSRLSICIPTYNRETFLKELLDSIISQADPDEVQIAISDNASSDQTKELVENIRLSYPNIAYFRWGENMGADRNYLKAVEISNGDYCWLMGSDDLIPSGAIKNMCRRLLPTFQTATATTAVKSVRATRERLTLKVVQKGK